MNFKEPDPDLTASVWAEVDAAYPSLSEEDPGFDERETLRASEFQSRYTTQRQAQIAADRLTLSDDEQTRLAAWDVNPVQPTSRYRRLGMREMKLREWVAADIERDAPTRAKTRAALRAQWDAMSNTYPFIGGPYRVEFEAANALLDEGRDVEAQMLIEYAEPKSAFNAGQIEAFNLVKAQFADAIKNLPD